MTEQVVNPIWQVFEKPLEDLSITDYEMLEYQERNINVTTLTNLQVINQDLDLYLYPFDSYLQVNCEILDAIGGADLTNAAGEDTTPVNNGWFNFSRAELYANDQLVEAVDDPGLASLMTGLTDLSGDYLASTGTNMMWYLDQGGLNDALVPTITAGEAAIANNAGVAARNARVRLLLVGIQYTMFLQPKMVFRFFRDNPKVFRGIKWTIRLIKNGAERSLMRTAAAVVTDAVAVVQINRLSWWIPAVKPNESVALSLNQSLNEGQKNIMTWKGLELIRSPLFLQANLNPEFRATTTSGRPSRIFVAFQRVERTTTNADTAGPVSNNTAIFDNYNVQAIHVRVNNKQYPREELLTDYTRVTAGDYSRAYMMFQAAGDNNHDPDSGSGVSYEDYRELYPIYVFDIHHSPNVFQNIQSFEVEVRARFRAIAGGAAYGNYFIQTLVEFDKEAIMTGVDSRMRLTL